MLNIRVTGRNVATEVFLSHRRRHTLYFYIDEVKTGEMQGVLWSLRSAREKWLALNGRLAGSCKSVSSMEKQHVNTRLTAPDCPDVVIGNPVQLEEKKKAIKSAGLSTLQVIADFDMTLTKYLVDGVRGQSTHALLKSNPAYDRKRHELFEYYYPLEISPTLPADEKAKHMEEWWEKSHALLIEGGLNYESIVSSVANATISFRDRITEFFETLDEDGVPLLIFSAGLADIIEEVLKQKLHRVFSNIRVVSNRMEFDDCGDLIGFKGKTIHVLNKNEHALEMAAPLHDDDGNLVGENTGAAIIQGRSNVLLLGDHLGDLGMSDGVDYDNRISIGFLNENAENWLETYKKAFDIVILNDGSLKPVIELVKELRT
ncbi:uncharacterized protein [Physcomitrium patens]|uniref:uncharacterized protein isoform X2 n=1 Tax=Physcomitrium patens TaxID=3218 RepID=UPI000D156854|nr:cytosolic 5'-nucleotidase 3-like isoform X2 [Physcomitrium patens]|eukprot:XP_024387720.1 cytosolic 5'-nucleotidase 3-like isoform X2 [Physcomitrella patens]